jgi:hypothetical protein
MKESTRLRWAGCSIYVILYGVFVGFSLIFECAIPFLNLMVERFHFTGWWIALVNQEFVIPLGIITWFYTSICAGYIGVDRAMFVVSTSQGEKGKIEEGRPDHIRHIIFESFIIYALAVGLNIIFNRNLSLEPLASAFGASVLVYVTGQKALKGASALAPEIDDDGNGIDDEIDMLIRQIDKRRKSGQYLDSTHTGRDDIIEDLESKIEIRRQEIEKAKKASLPKK